ncbi:hypothetical protein CSUI_008654 [Cystoisospora suis]|uniref:Uncharacterized protein n=1 Tax=Cystoisospora suis TaxID=483139 RepID=A0A2C6KM56_9APIC|nr:hypothetical protein CSUI_008654 [Cystoisospora suis]
MGCACVSFSPITYDDYLSSLSSSSVETNHDYGSGAPGGQVPKNDSGEKEEKEEGGGEHQKMKMEEGEEEEMRKKKMKERSRREGKKEEKEKKEEGDEGLLKRFRQVVAAKDEDDVLCFKAIFKTDKKGQKKRRLFVVYLKVPLYEKPPQFRLLEVCDRASSSSSSLHLRTRDSAGGCPLVKSELSLAAGAVPHEGCHGKAKDMTRNDQNSAKEAKDDMQVDFSPSSSFPAAWLDSSEGSSLQASMPTLQAVEDMVNVWVVENVKKISSSSLPYPYSSSSSSSLLLCGMVASQIEYLKVCFVYR